MSETPQETIPRVQALYDAWQTEIRIPGYYGTEAYHALEEVIYDALPVFLSALAALSGTVTQLETERDEARANRDWWSAEAADRRASLAACRDALREIAAVTEAMSLDPHDPLWRIEEIAVRALGGGGVSGGSEAEQA